MKCPLVSLIFLQRSLVFPILLVSFISLYCSYKKAFTSLLAIFWNSAFRWIYFFLSPLPFTSFLFSGICRASSGNHFAFLHFCFMAMVLISASYTTSGTSVHSSSGTLSIRPNPLNVFVTSTVFILRDLIGHSWMALWFSPTFLNLSLNFAIRSSWS